MGEAGRPDIPIDWDEVDKMLMGGADGTQCAAILGVHHDTFYHRCLKDKGIYFTEYSHRQRQKGNKYIHNKQYEVAMSGNTSMLIWLGKNRLGQSDKTEISGSATNPLQILIEDISGKTKELVHEEDRSRGPEEEAIGSVVETQ